MPIFRTALIALSFSTSVCALAAVATAAPADVQAAFLFDLPAQPLGLSLRAVSFASGRSIAAPAALVDGRTAPALVGRFTPEQALDHLLDASGLSWHVVGSALIITRATAAERGGLSSEIIVTGTRVRGVGPVGSNLIAVDRRAIEQRGYATTEQLVGALPQNFSGGANEGTVGFSVRNNANANFGQGSGINLRGLGNNSTLTLIDGNRPALGGVSGSFVDLSLIPTVMIDRIEVLADGASAIYGSDAVAGVVNVRLRRDFKGAETNVRYGGADGFREVQANQLLGTRWSSGHVTVGYEFYRRGNLGAGDRPYVTEDLRPFGGPDYRTAFANPATLVAANGLIFGVPQGQNGRGLTAEDLIPGVANLSDGRTGSDILPEQERHSVLAAADQELADWLTVKSEASYATRRSIRRDVQIGTAVSVSPTNPFYVDPIGTGQPVSVRYDFRDDLGVPTSRIRVTNLALGGALEGRLGTWAGELRGSYGRQREQQQSLNIVNRARLAQTIADTNPATAYNLFGDGPQTPQSIIDYVRGSSRTMGTSEQWSTAFKVDGSLFDLPGGPVRLAAGVEYRHERYAARSIDDRATLTPVPGASAGFPLGRTVRAAFAEIIAPILGPGSTGANRLELSVAGRTERYSDVGSTTNPKVGLSWRPDPAFTLRGSYGRSFRAPAFTDIRQGPGLSQVVPFPLADPSSPTGMTNAIALFGNRTDLRPEKARTWSGGIDYRSQRFPGLALSATYFNIDYRQRISNPAADIASFLAQASRFGALVRRDPSATEIAAFYASPDFLNPFGVAAGAIGAVVDARNANLARSRVEGLDFDGGYRSEAGAVAFDIGLSGTWFFRLTQQLTPGSSSVDVKATIGNPTDLRLRGRAIVSVDRWSVASFVNHSAGYLNNAVSPFETVGGFTTVDLTLAFRPDVETGALKGVRLALSINNLFDRAPPYVNNRTSLSAAGFDPEQASAVGRLVAFQIGKAW
ncbi:TonB-dependent receptor domain-containing protein [Rhizorhabdus sp. FW153]|uniref:TonB-dependent receptor domain-containing protein n=1 Tax=Rhizorhabdus sp. FW153 TaxID=3400216 RepID=UPI003CF5CDDF